jgi:hypothetical protein
MPGWATGLGSWAADTFWALRGGFLHDLSADTSPTLRN